MECSQEAVRERLLAELAKLEAVAQTGADAAQPVELDQTRVGRLSRMDAMQAQAISIETKHRREQQNLRLRAALRRLDAGDYGWCTACGEAIDPKRLAFDPAATQCIACAAAREA